MRKSDSRFVKYLTEAGALGWAVLACLTCNVSFAQEVPGTELVVPKKIASPWAERPVPQPLPHHPGNIYVEGEAVLLPLPDDLPETALVWHWMNERGEILRMGKLTAEGVREEENLAMGSWPVGYYRMVFQDPGKEEVAWTSAAVLAPLRTSIPEDSPVGVDAAISWFAGKDRGRQEEFANLAALAGVNWVRDRLRWRDVQPEEDTWREATEYDMAAEIQHHAGLKVLQVFHDTPPWAREGGSSGEFARDLRHLHDFCRALARRFQGKVQAWEPWNEANVTHFGGHTVDEMCSWQKAAWLGFKAGDPGVIVGWNATAAAPTEQHTQGVLANEVWPYFDTYNIHTYDWAHSYADLWKPALKAACGRPLWITESDRGLKHLNNPPWYDLSRRNERLKAEYMAQSYAQSLFTGASRHFHFILGHYQEPNGVQFGLLRKDLTPRPAYVALAALGRFLAGAQVLGRWRPGPDLHVYGFRARPDGEPKDVLVAWAEKEVDWPARGAAQINWELPGHVTCEKVFDYLGRPQKLGRPGQLRSAPAFLILPAGEADKLTWQTQPEREFRPGDPSPLVLQIIMPKSRRIRVEDRSWSEGYAYRFDKGEEVAFEVAAYNFSGHPIKGRLQATDLPQGWRVQPGAWDLNIAPMERKTGTFQLRTKGEQETGTTRDGWIRFRASAGSVPQAAVAFRMVQK